MSAREIEESTQFEDSPSGWAQRWQVELAAARKEVEKWHASGDRIVDRYQDIRSDAKDKDRQRWNLFTANVQTQQALLYGRTPAVSVSRRFADSADDVARVAGEMMERLLNADVEREGDTYAEALGYALSDRLLPGFGLVRIRYDAEFEGDETELEEVSEAGEGLESPGPMQRKVYECVETDYVYWKDVLWSPARVWHEVRWVAFKAEMSKEEVAERFPGTENAIPYRAGAAQKDGETSPDPWARAEVWEIWDKASRSVFWYVEGYGQTLDVKADILKLTNFFPCPRPMLANAVTKKVLPRPDFVIAQDLYDEIDTISARVSQLTDALAARGVYDKNSEGVKQLLQNTGRNELVPVENWAMFAEKGGVKGQIDWLPLDQIVGAITALDQRREVVKAALYEVTGMSDLMRGQAAAAGVTATEQSIKARFASVRLQALQDDFARFASDVQRLKAEVISRLYDDATILERSNVALTPDRDVAPQAIALLRSQFSSYRVQVKPESVSMTDFAQMQEERTGVLGAVAQFMTASAPLMAQNPAATPFLLEMLQWFVSGQRGAAEIEGVLDRAIEGAKQQAAQPQQPQPDTKLQAAQLKAAADLQKVEAESRARVVELQAEVDADARREQNQMVFNVREAAAKQQISQAGRPTDGA